MVFYFNLFNYRTEKECSNIYDAYDYLMQLIQDFHIDMDTAKRYYTITEYMSLFGISACQLGNRWKGKKNTDIRHCNFGVVDIGIPVTHFKTTQKRLENFIIMLNNIKRREK